MTPNEAFAAARRCIGHAADQVRRAQWLCRGCIGVGPLEFSEAPMRWRGLAVLLLLALGLSLASCATQTVPNVHKPPGFLMGLLHGFISLFFPDWKPLLRHPHLRLPEQRERVRCWI